MRLRSRQRLRSQADFAAVRTKGRRWFSAVFVFVVLRREGGATPGAARFGVVASRRVGGAVVRNRLKRRLRAIFREHQRLFPPEVDVVVTLREAAARAAFAELEAAFVAAAARAGFREPAGPPAGVEGADAG